MLKDWIGAKGLNIPFLACSNSGSDMVKLKLDWGILVGWEVKKQTDTHKSREDFDK